MVVFVRIVANPIANVFQKRLTERAAHPVVVIGTTHALMTFAVLPFVMVTPWTALGPAFWGNMWTCAVLAVAGNVLLVAALRSTDLSVLGPINSYKVVVSLALGVVLLGEVPTAFGAVGIVLTVAGSALVVDRAPGQGRTSAFGRFLQEPGIQLRFGALACSATEAVFLKRAILHSSPVIVFLCWVMLALPLATLAAVVVLRREAAPQLRQIPRDWQTYAWLALATGVMQLATLLAFGTLQVGYSLALFQLSTVVSVALGAHFFAEQNIRRRLAGSIVMMIGAALIVTLGRARP
jgi:drug/metabolite transporter (DMT)-like permease